MTSRELDAFGEFARAFERWRWLLPPIGDLGESNCPTYSIDLDLDHEMTSLATVGERALKGDTRADWAAIVPRYLADLDTIARNANAAYIPKERKKSYQDYISECQNVWHKIGLLPVPSEGHLGFRKQVLAKFSFLEDLYGFQVVETTPIKVRYESGLLFVELNHSPSAPELGFKLGELKVEGVGQSFSLDDLSYWANVGSRFAYDCFDLGSADGVAAFVSTAAQFVERHAGTVLRNDTDSLQSLAIKQRQRERLIVDGNPETDGTCRE